MNEGRRRCEYFAVIEVEVSAPGVYSVIYLLNMLGSVLISLVSTIGIPDLPDVDVMIYWIRPKDELNICNPMSNGLPSQRG